ncbi:hypothetical protein EV122DRAFT_224033, partial [Schizophyllum commune]
DHVSSLLVFSNLVHLSIGINTPLSLTDEDVRQMSLAWPRIQWLALCGTRQSPESGKPSRCTLPALLWFAHHCAELAWLEIDLDAHVVVIPSGLPSEATQHSLRTLLVTHSPIASSADVAQFLARHFPGIRNIDGGEERGDVYRWIDVREELWRIAKEG